MAADSADRWPRKSEDCILDDLVALVDQASGCEAPSASEWASGLPVYQGALFTDTDTDTEPEAGAELRLELAQVLQAGPGALVIRGAVATEAVDRATAVFRTIIDEQHRKGQGAGDHYAKPGANDRVWNAVEKLALAAPEVFVDYYSSPALAAVSDAWLGPGYQVTSQVNVINPGGDAQQPHRDYHLGFTTEAVAAAFPRQAHLLSPALTLQGAVAHGEIPIASGPTKLLPHSQKYEPGYLAWRRPDFVEFFERRHVQVALSSGDAVFFNPALFHAGGANHTQDVRRMANLLQVSSAMGRAMERVDRRAMTLALFPALQRRVASGQRPQELGPVVAASAEGYPFPADLDRDQPVGRLTPPSQAELLMEALEQGWTVEQLEDRLT